MTCLVTLRHQNRQWDLELPSEVPSVRLVEMLIEALQLPRPASSEQPLRLSIEPFGATVGPDQSLASAEVRDGTILVLSNAPAQSVKAVTDSVGDGPAARWRPVVPSEAPAEAAPGYQWKKLAD